MEIQTVIDDVILIIIMAYKTKTSIKYTVYVCNIVI